MHQPSMKGSLLIAIKIMLTWVPRCWPPNPLTWAEQPKIREQNESVHKTTDRLRLDAKRATVGMLCGADWLVSV